VKLSLTYGHKKIGSCFLLASLVGCATLSSLFETGMVSFKPNTALNQSFHLNQLNGATVVLLPVRSIMGGGLGEEKVTKHLNQTLKAKFTQVKLITDEEASDLFTQMDLWDDYFNYLVKYYRDSVTDFDELRSLYGRLGGQYIMSVTADYTSFSPMYPRTFMLFIHVQIWDLVTGKLVWEGRGEGEDVIEAEAWEDEVVTKMIKRVCKRIVQEMGTSPKEAK